MAVAEPPSPAPDDGQHEAPAGTTGRRALLLAAILAAVLAGGAMAGLLLRQDGGGAGTSAASGATAPAAVTAAVAGPLDPLRYDPAREQEYQDRFARGLAHVLYAKSPGGAEATAARVAAYRPQIEAAVAGTDIPPDVLEAMVFLESGGRPDVLASADVAGAAGLAQIVAGTATDFLGMDVDLGASRSLTRRIAAAEAAGDASRAEELRAQRRYLDQRFDPEQALAGAVRYLVQAEERFGRLDLAVASYHMGIGNLEGVIRSFANAGPSTPVREIVEREDLSYARLAIDASPLARIAAWQELQGLGDDSATYLWRVLAARDAMGLFRQGGDALASRAALETAKASSEEVLHPEGSTEVFADPAALAAAWERGDLVAVQDDAARGIAIDPGMGQLAPTLGADPALYRGLRPAALDALSWLAATARAASGSDGALTATSTVRDAAYQGRLLATNPEATPNYSLHTTGYAFDVARRYPSPAFAAGFQFALDRLSELGLIAWVREPGAIHATASEDARGLPAPTG